MSAESLRARLETLPGEPWHLRRRRLFLTHAPTDLRLTLTAAEQGKELADAIREYFAPNPPSDHFIPDLLAFDKRWEELEAAP